MSAATHTAPAAPPVDPRPSRGRTWTVTTTSGTQVTGDLPEWADEDPSTADVAPECLDLVLADIVHQTSRGGLLLPVTRSRDPAEKAGVLVVTIDCAPFRGADDGGVPVANVQIVDDVRLRDLDPPEVAHLGRQLRSLADLLTGPVTAELATIRAEWTGQHTPPAHTPGLTLAPTAAASR